MKREEHNAQVLLGLRADFCAKVALWLLNCEQQGLQVWLVEGLRSSARQFELYKHGRTQLPNGGPWMVTDKKQVLTNAMSALNGPHPRGGAIDFCPMIDGVLVWKREDLFKSAGALGEQCGMKWGGNFKGKDAKALGDLDHLEDPFWRTFPLPAPLPES